MNPIFLAAGVAAYILVMIVSIIEFPWPVTAILAMLPALAITASARSLFLLVPFATLHSGMFIPGLPGNFQLYQAMCIAFIAHWIATFAITKNGRPQGLRLERLCALFLIGWIVALIAVRGSGMRVLGSGQIGGAVYFQTLFVLAFYLLASDAPAKPRHLMIAGTLMGLVSILPAMANAAFVLSGGAVWHQLLFFRHGGALGEATQAFSAGLGGRLTFLSPMVAILWVGVFRYTQARGIAIGRLTLWAIAALLALISGFRSLAASTLLFFGIYGFLQSRNKFAYTMIAGFGAATLLVFLYTFSSQLPYPVQRVISNLPGIEVNMYAKAQGEATIAWRQSIWDLASDDLDQYWLFGRGITHDPRMIPFKARYVNDPIISYITGDFHQASLELLVLYGAPAFAACILLYLAFLARGIRTQRTTTWATPALRDWSLCILIYVGLRATLAFAAGQSTELLTTLPIWMALHGVIASTNREENARTPPNLLMAAIAAWLPALAIAPKPRENTSSDIALYVPLRPCQAWVVGGTT